MNYFKEALGNFTMEAACGGAIRHLADLGYAAGQIKEKLDYPAPYDRVREIYTDYLLEREILLKEEPGREEKKEKSVFVREQDSYGRASFRKVVTPIEETAHKVSWKKICVTVSLEEEYFNKLTQIFREKDAYVRCIFAENGMLRSDLVSCLKPGQIQYLDGIVWQKGIRYHRVDERIQGILRDIAENYRGDLQFLL